MLSSINDNAGNIGTVNVARKLSMVITGISGATAIFKIIIPRFSDPVSSAK
jgi:hypothetical protein